MLNISQVILMRTDSNLCRKELTVHWSAPNSLIRSYLQPCTNSMWGDESEAVAPIIWLYQIVDAQKEEVCFPVLLITLRSYGYQGQAHMGNIVHFRLRNGWSFESVEGFETENAVTRGLEPTIFRFMPNALTVWAIGATHFLYHV